MHRHHIYTKELRQGNVVEFMGSPVTVIVIYGNRYIGVAERVDPISMIEIKGVPITPEWLEKFGAKKGFDDTYDLPGMPSYVFIDGQFSPYDSFYYGFMPEIKYVHQLQNLYFAVTGKELELHETV